MTITDEYFKYTTTWKEKYGEKTLVLMQVGQFYEVYALKDSEGKIIGSDIEEFARMNDLLIGTKNYTVRGPIDKITKSKEDFKVTITGINITQLDKYLENMDNNKYTYVIYNQDFPGKNSTRSLSEIISPGTFFTSSNTKQTNNIMCVWLECSRANKILPSQITIGVSCIDVFTGKTNMSQFTKEYNHNPCTYDELERLVAINKPSECILITNIDEKYLEDIINYSGISNVKVHKVLLNTDTEMSKFAECAQKQTYQHAVCKQFFPNISSEYLISIFPTHIIAIQSFIFLLDFVYKQNPNLVNKILFPMIENIDSRLTLANHSLQQLNIIDEGRHTGKLKSVGNLLNQCITAMGQREFYYNLHNPNTDIKKLNMSYDITEHILKKDTWQNFRNMLNGINDIEKLTRKLILKKITPKDLSILYNELNIIISLDKATLMDKKLNKYIQTLRKSREGTSSNEKPEKREITKLSEILKKEIDQHFYVEKCLEVNNVTQEHLSSLSIDKLSFIKPGKCKQVDSLLENCVDARNKLESISNWLSSKIMKLEKKVKTTNLIKIHETARSDPILIGTKRRVTMLKAELDKANKKTVDLTYTDFSGKSQTFNLNYEDLDYVTMGSNKSDLVVTNKLINSLTSKIQTSETKLVTETIVYYRKYLEDFTKNQPIMSLVSNFVRDIDIVQCKAYIAHKYNYVRPTLVEKEKSFFDVKNIRHPLIEHLQTNEIYVTNDVALGHKNDGLLLYGTNAVGKTSLIKAIGINIIMAQAGLFVACSEMKLKPYQAIFTRILGNDNIFKGLSTFEVEMSELCTILKLADKNSLILGDELCSGTESDSALSIFTASLETLHERQSTFLFATHFHEIQKYKELKALKNITSKHMVVAYDKEKDVLVYDRKLKDGPGDSMYGLEVCKSLHLPDVFLERAHKIRMKYNKTKRGVLGEKKSNYNKKKLVIMCEMCREEKASDTHHLRHQKDANKKNSYIDNFHKNHTANLMSLCEACHHKIHEKEEQHKRVKTSNGYELVPC